MKEHNYYVYILAKARNSTFYTGVTNDLVRRVYKHKAGIIKGFTWEYNIKMLVYYEHHTDIRAAIRREKLIKRWKREYKLNVIEAMNPDWKDLYFELIGEPDPAVSVTPRLSRGPDPAMQRGDKVGENV